MRYPRKYILLGSAPSVSLFKWYTRSEDDFVVACNEVIESKLKYDLYFTIEHDCFKRAWYRKNIPFLDVPVICRESIRARTQKLNHNISVQGVEAEVYQKGMPFDRVNRGFLYAAGTVLTPMLHYAVLNGAETVIICGFDQCYTPEAYYYNKNARETVPGYGTVVHECVSMNGKSKFTSESFLTQARIAEYIMRDVHNKLGVNFYIMDNGEGIINGDRVTPSQAREL